VLVDHRRARARMTQPSHQLPKGRPANRGQRPAHMPQVMKVQARNASPGARS
jgi:hypothetical protein